jgi:alpha-ketoglutarate-dependent taurine dioxygenase
MLNNNTLITSHIKNESIAGAVSTDNSVWKTLETHGFCLLRDYSVNLKSFSDLVHQMCSTVTLDPARTNSAAAVQKVDAGVDALGLHIENGNTPNAPELVFFYCKTAPKNGSQTTVCDGLRMLGSLPEDIRQRFIQTLFVTRTISEEHWKTYLANEHPLLESADQVRAVHLSQMLAAQDNIEGTLNADSSLTYRLAVNPLLSSRLCKQQAFANAILGPSFSYQAPTYEFADGSTIDDSLKNTLSELAEIHTIEIPWEDGDIAIIDNHRVMHGRREITDRTSREIFIGMGNT